MLRMLGPYNGPRSLGGHAPEWQLINIQRANSLSRAMLPRVLVLFAPGDGPLAETVEEALIQSGFLPRMLPGSSGGGGSPLPGALEEAERAEACVLLLTQEMVSSGGLKAGVEALQRRMPLVSLVSDGVRPADIPEGLESSPLDSYTLGRIGALLQRELIRFRRRFGERSRSEADVCGRGPYELSAGRLVEIPLAAAGGEVILGTLTEEDGDDFRWCVLDERSLRRLESGAEYHAEASDEGFGFYRFRWEVPGPGPWFLVLLSPGKKGSRLVTVRVRRERGQEGAGSRRANRG